jgi:hypothetical protein
MPRTGIMEICLDNMPEYERATRKSSSMHKSIAVDQ